MRPRASGSNPANNRLVLVACASLAAFGLFTAEALAHPVEAPKTACIEGVTGAIYPGGYTSGCTLALGDTDRLSFDALPGEEVRIVVTFEDFLDPIVRVYEPNAGEVVLVEESCDGGVSPGTANSCPIAIDISSAAHRVSESNGPVAPPLAKH